MKKCLLIIFIVFFSFQLKAQISGSDTVCAAYRYSYTVTMPGAVSFMWTLPTGWYFLSGQGTDSIYVNCNDSVGQVCVTGYDTSGTVVASICKSVMWGVGGIGWNVDGTPLCPCPGCGQILSITPTGGSGGSCGNGSPNPNIIFAAFDWFWPAGNYLGQVNGSNPFFNISGSPLFIYVYQVDTTFGINNMILVQGGNGGVINNLFVIGPIYTLTAHLTQVPDTVCIGDTFVVTTDTIAGTPLASYLWSTGSTNITLTGNLTTSLVTGVITGQGTGISEVFLNGFDFSGCHWGGSILINFTTCSTPVVSTITGSDTVCAGYIYSYTAQIPGAVSFNWTLPYGWYIISGQGTDSVVVNCNDSVGQVCVTGYGAGGNPLATICKPVTWGTGGMGWHVTGISNCICHVCTYKLFVIPNGSACAGGCGSGIQNPHIIFAGFSAQWPNGNYLGQVTPATNFRDVTGVGTTVYVYPVDTTFGLDSMLLVKGGSGCGTVNNSFFIPPNLIPPPTYIPLIQDPSPVCIGDTFVVYLDPFSSWGVGPITWYSSANITLIGSFMFHSVTAVLNGPGAFTEIFFNATDWTGCDHFYGGMFINYSSCTPPTAGFHSNDTTLCLNACINFTNTSQNATSYQWYFPGATPSSSTAVNPANICYHSSGQFDVTLIAINSYGRDTVLYSQYITVFPIPSVSIIQSNDTLSAQQGFSNYKWYLNNTIISGATNSFYVATQNGTYTLSVTDSNGCQSGDTIIFTGITSPISGSDTVCAGYIYSYAVDIPGAVSFNWTLPYGWYIISGQGTDSVVVNCNDSVGQVCVTGYGAAGNPLASLCKTVTWGTGGVGWQVNGTSTCICNVCTYILYVSPNGPGCAGGCGSGIQNPNIIFAGFDSLWPGGTYLSQVNGTNNFHDVTGFGTTVYVYPVDTTFGIDSMLLVQGGPGCGTVNNTFFIPAISFPTPILVPLIQIPNPVCIGDTFVISMSSIYSSLINQFSWSTISPNISIVGPAYDSAVTVVLTGPGINAQIDFSGIAGNGCDQYRGSIILSYNTCITPSSGFYSSDTAFCPNTCVNFTNTTLNATSYQWYFPGATPSSSTNPNPSNICYSSAGQFNVTLIASNTYGSDTLIYTGYLTAHSPAACPITLNADTLFAPQGFSGYQWYMDTSVISGATSYFYIASQNAFYTVVVTDSNGCTTSSTLLDTTAAQFPTALFLTGSAAFCVSNCLNFTNLSQYSSSYQWIFPGGNPASSTSVNPQNICYSTSGSYDVTLIASNGSASDTVTLANYITVFPAPAPFTISQVADTLFAPNTFALYQWYYQLTPISGATNYFYLPTQNGSYNLLATDNNGCIMGAGIINISVGTNEFSAGSSELAVFPNPASNNFSIIFTIQKKSFAEIELLNTLGEVVYNTSPETLPGENAVEISTGNLPEGIYLVKVSILSFEPGGEKNVWNRKLVVIK